MKNPTYNTGEIPMVGDVVKVAQGASFGSGYSTRSCPYSLSRDKEYMVKKTWAGSASQLISVTDNHGHESSGFRAVSFNLVKRSQDAGPAPRMKYAIMSSGKLVGMAKNADDLDKTVAGIVTKDIRARISVYTLEWTVEAPAPQVKWSRV